MVNYDFKAEFKDKELKIKPIIEKKDNGDMVLHLPSFQIINKLKQEYNNGKRNL